ncbi:MAG: gliding motility-associated C-terminal domain-containing protein [Chitinophagaceae bacterium]
MGCRFDTLLFSHDGAHDVNSWNWTFNNTINITTQNHSIIFPASSTNTVKLTVSNGVCTDSITDALVVLNNEVKAAFEMPATICPEDPCIVIDSSKGLINSWSWNFDIGGTSTAPTPSPVFFPQTNIEAYYPVKLTVTNNALGCRDSSIKILRVLNNCFIAVPTGFTPNNDGLNDYLYPNNAIKAKDLQFSVYNRWGQLVFTTRDWQLKWDGKLNGLPQPSGVYVWYLRYTHLDTGKKVFKKGTTTLIR